MWDCSFCRTSHHPLDGCPTSALKHQCSSCKDTGIVNPGWAVQAFVDEPCPCIKYRCRECFNLLERDEDPCQKCGALIEVTHESPDEIGIEGVLKSFENEQRSAA